MHSIKPFTTRQARAGFAEYMQEHTSAMMHNAEFVLLDLSARIKDIESKEDKSFDDEVMLANLIADHSALLQVMAQLAIWRRS